MDTPLPVQHESMRGSASYLNHPFLHGNLLRQSIPLFLRQSQLVLLVASESIHARLVTQQNAVSGAARHFNYLLAARIRQNAYSPRTPIHPALLVAKQGLLVSSPGIHLVLLVDHQVVEPSCGDSFDFVVVQFGNWGGSVICELGTITAQLVLGVTAHHVDLVINCVIFAGYHPE